MAKTAATGLIPIRPRSRNTAVIEAPELHHNSRYDFNDDAIASGVALWTTLVEQELREV